MPALILKSSSARCPDVPLPADAKANVPGFAFASAMSSFTDFAATDGCTTRMLGSVMPSVIGAKSLSGSYATLG